MVNQDVSLPVVVPPKASKRAAAANSASNSANGDTDERPLSQRIASYLIGWSSDDARVYPPPIVAGEKRLHPFKGEKRFSKRDGFSRGVISTLVAVIFEVLASVQSFLVGNLQDFEDYYLTKFFGEHREVLTELKVIYAVDMAMNFVRDLVLVISFLPNLLRWLLIGSTKFPILDPFLPHAVSVFPWLPNMIYTALFNPGKYDEINLKEGNMLNRLSLWDIVNFIFGFKTEESLITTLSSNESQPEDQQPQWAAPGLKTRKARGEWIYVPERDTDGDVKMVGTGSTIAKDEARFPNAHFYHVNGMLTTSNVAIGNGRLLEELFGQPIKLVFNPTWGFIIDSLECLLGRTFGLRTKPSARLAALVEAQLIADKEANEREFESEEAIQRAYDQERSEGYPDWPLDEHRPKINGSEEMKVSEAASVAPGAAAAAGVRKIVIIGHSQGTLITNDVMRYLTRRYKDDEAMLRHISRSLEVYLVGCAADEVRRISNEHLEVFSNTGDWISNMSVLHPYFSQYIEGHRFDVDRIGHMFVMDYMKHFVGDCQKIAGDSELARKTRLSKYFSPKYCAELGVGFAPPGYYL